MFRVGLSGKIAHRTAALRVLAPSDNERHIANLPPVAAFRLRKQEAVISTPRAMPPPAHWVEFEAVRAAGNSSSAIVKPRGAHGHQPRVSRSAQKVRFAADSPVEGTGFEPV